MDSIVLVILAFAFGGYFFWFYGVKEFILLKEEYKRRITDPERLEYIKRHRFNSAPEHKMRDLYPSLSISEVEESKGLLRL